MTKIKTRLTAFLTAAACLTGSIGAMTASALDIGFSYKAAAAITIETDTFTYANSTLTTDAVDANFMVVGVYQSDDPSEPCYSCDVIHIYPNGTFGDLGMIHHSSMVEYYTDGTPLQIGDLLKIEDGEILECYPTIVNPWGTVTNLGNGADLLGEEFKRVIRLQALRTVSDLSFLNGQEKAFELAQSRGIIDYFGDVNVDDAVDILDCITVNKQLLGSEQISDYVRIFGDVNGDGVLDSTDSLMILKEVVGLTENFEEV